MSRFINSIVLGLVSFIVLLSIFWYVVEVRHENRVEISELNARWGPADQTTTNVLWDFKFQNTHKSLVQLTRIQYEMAINDYVVSPDEDVQNLSLRIPAEGSASTTLGVAFPTAFMNTWIKAHADGQERSWIVFRGTASLLINQGLVEIPFDVMRDWESALAADVTGALRSCGQANVTLCLDGGEARWDTSGSATILAQVQLRNPSESTMTASDFRFVLQLNGIQVALGTSAESVSVAADQAASFLLPLTFDGASLHRWWPKHVDSCERSPVLIRAEYTVSGGAANETTRAAQDFPAPTFESRFVCGTA